MAARTITQPANGSALDSSVIRNQLQLIENEVASPSSVNPGHLHSVAGLNATGTPSSVTFLRGDNTWSTPAGAGIGTVTSVSVASSNGFSGSVANATSTPAITLSTTASGVLKGNGGALSAATVNVDYQGAITLTTTGTSGAATLVGATLNIPQYSGGGGTGITWNEVTGTTQAAAINNGYITNNAALVTVTLPSTAAQGSVVELSGKGAGGWKLAQNSGQTINFGITPTTTGTGGSLASVAQYDTLRVLCITANTTWVVLSSQGNITVT